MAHLPWLRHRKADIPGDLWVRCPACDETVFNKDLDDRLKTCPKCNFHFPLSSHLRIAYTLDAGSWQEIDASMETVDALGFVDKKPYPEKLAVTTVNTGVKEAMRYGLGTIEGRPLVFGTLEFRFMGGSMGVVVGEKVTRAAELALRYRHRAGVSLYTSAYAFAETCVFSKQSPDPFHCGPPAPRRTVSSG